MRKRAKTPAAALAAADGITAEDIAEVQGVALRKAKDGDVPAMSLLARMQWRDGPVELDLPPITGAESLAEAQARVIAAAAGGLITARQALSFSTILEWRRRALDTVQSERALDALEAANARRAAEQATKR